MIDPHEVSFGDLPDDSDICEKCDAPRVLNRAESSHLDPVFDCDCRWCDVCCEKTYGCECHETGDSSDDARTDSAQDKTADLVYRFFALQDRAAEAEEALEPTLKIVRELKMLLSCYAGQIVPKVKELLEKSKEQR